VETGSRQENASNQESGVPFRFNRNGKGASAQTPYSGAWRRRNPGRAIAIIAGSFAKRGQFPMIRKLRSGEYRLYSRKLNPKTGKRRNLGTFKSRAAAEKHERAVQYFKRH
jgi:hypothetical protein